MPLPARSFWTITEVAARWGCTPHDIISWATADRFEILTAIPPVTCGEATVTGMLAVSPIEIMPMFRRCGTGPRSLPIRMVRLQPNAPLQRITEPSAGHTVEAADLVMRGEDVNLLEEEWGIAKRGPGNPHGPKEKYPWETMYAYLCKRIYEDGLPDALSELVGEIQEWFARRDPNETPDERTIRRRLQPIWDALRERA